LLIYGGGKNSIDKNSLTLKLNAMEQETNDFNERANTLRRDFVKKA
jgi:hypothetical protein